MKVADLQSFLRSLAQPLEASGGKKAAADLERAGEGLERFKDWSVPEFADFLARAEEYARTGIVPKKGTSATRKKTADPEKVRAVAQRLRDLYERATDDALSYTEIESEVQKAGKQLLKDDTLQVAKELGISGSLKTKKDALAAIERKIAERKESYQRTRF